jgi:hypothetical protein
MDIAMTRVDKVPLTILQLLILMSSPAIGWLALHLVYPAQRSGYYALNFALMDAATTIMCGLALVSPIVLGLQYGLQDRQDGLFIGEWLWLLQFAVTTLMFMCYLASLSQLFWMVLSGQVVSGCVALAATAWSMARSLAGGSRPPVLWSDWTGRFLAVSITAMIVYRLLW